MDAFMPMVSIDYSSSAGQATVTPGDVFGVWHVAEAWALPFERLALYTFQLVDKGYLVDSLRRDDESVRVRAYSPEYQRRKGWG